MSCRSTEGLRGGVASRMSAEFFGIEESSELFLVYWSNITSRKKKLLLIIIIIISIRRRMRTARRRMRICLSVVEELRTPGSGL